MLVSIAENKGQRFNTGKMFEFRIEQRFRAFFVRVGYTTVFRDGWQEMLVPSLCCKTYVPQMRKDGTYEIISHVLQRVHQDINEGKQRIHLPLCCRLPLIPFHVLSTAAQQVWYIQCDATSNALFYNKAHERDIRCDNYDVAAYCCYYPTLWQIVPSDVWACIWPCHARRRKSDAMRHPEGDIPLIHQSYYITSQSIALQNVVFQVE